MGHPPTSSQILDEQEGTSLSLSDVLCLEIVDDGLGLPQDYRAGVVMTSMRERAAELGGSCVIEAAIPSGTRVCARLPFLKEDL